MKAILVIDMPENCWECPCYDGYWQCGATGKSFEIQDEIHNQRPDWCPLRPMPRKIDANDWHRMFGGKYEIREAKGYGWNACLCEILGGRENER